MAQITRDQTFTIATKIYLYFWEKERWAAITNSTRPGLVTINVRDSDYKRHEEIDDIIWNEFGCHSISWEIIESRDDLTGPLTVIHYYEFDNGEIRQDFDGDMALILEPLPKEEIEEPDLIDPELDDIIV